MPFNQKQYINEYNKANYKMVPFRVRKDDELIINKLSSIRNVNKYIRSLIEKDVNPQVLTIKQIKERILPIMFKHGLHEVYLFGSYARGEANNDSDVDIYCEHGDIKGFFDWGFFEEELENALQKDVDIVFIGSDMLDFFKEQLDKDKIKLC